MSNVIIVIILLIAVVFGMKETVVLFAWDTFILDWILFANIKRLRLPGTEHMEREYHQCNWGTGLCIHFNILTLL